MHEIKTLREMVKVLINENKDQKERMNNVLNTIDKVNSKVEFTEKVISSMEHNGVVPEVIADMLNMELNKVNEERTCDRWIKKPMSYLNKVEINEFESILKEIKTMDFRELIMDETFIYKFIDQVTTRYKNDFENSEEKEDDLIITNEKVNFTKLQILHDRDVILKFLIRRLTNEIAYQKQKSMIEILKLNQ